MAVEKLHAQKQEQAEFLRKNPVILIAAEAANFFYNEISQERFGLAEKSWVKSGGYEVTLLDKSLEELLTDRLKVAMPHMRLVGEENGPSALQDSHTSVCNVDPLDGTKTLLLHMERMRLDWYKRRGILPDCNIMGSRP